MKKLLVLLLFAMVFIGVNAQNTRTVTGTVVFAGDDEPLPGATVIPADRNTGVITDVNGQFSITLPKTVKNLRVSYVGMLTQEVHIGDQPLLIKLSSADNALNEVVVTALGMKRERKGLGLLHLVQTSIQLQRAALSPQTRRATSLTLCQSAVWLVCVPFSQV